MNMSLSTLIRPAAALAALAICATGTPALAATGQASAPAADRGTSSARSSSPRATTSGSQKATAAVSPVTQVAMSPDGKTIAFTYIRPSCPEGADCTYRYATGYTSSTKLTQAGASTFYYDPSWVTNTRTLQTGGFLSQVELQDINSTARHWFDDSDLYFPDTDLTDGELSPDGRWLAEVRGYDDTTSIMWYSVNGNAQTGTPPPLPNPECVTN